MSVRAEAKVRGVCPSAEMRRRQSADGYTRDGVAWCGYLQGADGKFRPSRKTSTKDRDALIVSRRGEGATFRAIASELGWSVGTVHRVAKARTADLRGV